MSLVKPKRQIAVAGVRSSSGLYIRIPLITIADMVHVFALAMGYNPVIAFAMGVISRTPPEVQSGQLDLTPELAAKTIRIAQMIAECRQNACVPTDPADCEMVRSAAAHIHNVEKAYDELCEQVPGIAITFQKQYADWTKYMEKREAKKTRVGFFKRIAKLFHLEPGQDR